ncbi:MAG: hypothetical protein SGILL_010349, partial [Bacillariaceae sp.]
MMFRRVAFTILVLHLGLQNVHASEELVSNAAGCSNLQDPKRRLDCRKARAGGQGCSDLSKCRDPSSMQEVLVHVPIPSLLSALSNGDPTGKTTLYGPVDGTRSINTWDAALDFCIVAIGHSGIAYLGDYCMGGEHGTLTSAVDLELSSDQWAPIGDCVGCYVQVGNGHGGPCVLHTTVAGETPAWGRHGGKEQEESNFILCVDYSDDSKPLNLEDSSGFLREDSRDANAMMPVYQCSDSDAARRIGMTCNDFPGWNGGWPILAGGIRWDDEWESYSCVETSAGDTNSSIVGGSFCQQWRNKENSAHEYELGLYECKS